MAIRRGPVPADSFTIIANDWLRDPALSWKAKGLLAYIASHAPGHCLTVEQILAEGDDGRDAARAGLRELETAGYLQRVKLRGTDAKITGTDYILTEPERGKPGAGKPVAGSDQQEQPVSAGESHSGFPGAGKPAGKKTTSPEDQKKTPSASPRGTRLPKDWEPSEELKSWAAERLPVGWQAWAAVELEKFRNYWAAKTGSGATKLDWSATFRNWMLTAADRHGIRPAATSVQQFKTSAEKAEERKERERERTQLADQLYAERGIPMTDAYALAGEMIAAKAVTTCTPVGYIDGEVTEIDAPAQKEVTPR